MNNRYNILVVDDEEGIRWSLREYFINDESILMYEAPNGQKALDIIKKEYIDLVLLDIVLPDISGLDLINEIRKISLITKIIIITAYADVKDVVNAMKNGAIDFIEKPINLDILKIRILNALESYIIQNSLREIVDCESLKDGNIYITKDNKTKGMLEYCKMLANKDVDVILITGETGSGKGHLAKYIYNFNKIRNGKSYIVVNCNSFSSSIMDSELFGYEKGAFTDAKDRKDGLFKAADHGVILLDEIGDMHPELQGKLLRVLEEKAVRRIGGTKDDIIDVMVILATNKDIVKLVDEGRFRKDLYYRINTFVVNISPLRERLSDIIPLAYYFIEYYNKRFNKNFSSIDDDTMNYLLNYKWPGNIRELSNMLERAVLIGSGNRISIDMLRSYNKLEIINDINNLNNDLNIMSLDELEIYYNNKKVNIINNALITCDWNISKAAKILGIDRSTLNYNMKKLSVSSK